ncbi:MAG TPA: hypothetical protein VEF04_10045 [Blastocatellia bacterium]|nr:hypothetical protein [Blastocatellia bacterium]
MLTTRTLLRWPTVLSILALLTSAAMAQLTAPPGDVRISDQKAGSILVFPYYTSDGATADTSIVISHAGGTGNVNIHLFFVDGSNCGIADAGLTLTPHATLEFPVSAFDPMITGYLIAVAVDDAGCPVNQNVLIGHAFVKTPPNYIAGGAGQVRGDYGAEAIRAISPTPVNCNDGIIRFDNVAYEAVPNAFVAQIQSPVTVVGQTIVLASLQGGAGGIMDPIGQFGVGYIFDPNERPFSFSGFLRSGCHSITTLTTNSPRVNFGMSNVLKAGQTGLIKFVTRVGGVGLIFTPDNATGFMGIRTLHKYATTTTTTLTVPIF